MMLRSKPVALILLLVMCSLASAQWRHVSPGQAALGEALELRFDNPAESRLVLEALLHLEQDGSALETLEAEETGAGLLVFTVPSAWLSGRELAYRLELRTVEGRMMLPASGSWRVALAPRDQLAVVELLSEATVAAGEPALLAFSALLEEADLSSATLSIDGAAVDGVEADPWLLTWSGELAAGDHTVELVLNDSAGRALPRQRFRIHVNGAHEIPTGFTADAWQEFNMDHQDGRSAEWGRYHAAQFRFKAWRGEGRNALRMKGRFLLSALDLESDNLQPQSRFSVDLESRFAKLGLGDRQPDFGEAVLYGTRVRGVELGLDSRLFGLKALTGTTRSGLDAIIRLDTLDNGAVELRRDFAGSYERKLHGIDLRFGERNGLVESGLSFLKVKDELDGADVSPADFGLTESSYAGDLFYQEGDTLASISPVDNVVAALRMNVNAFRGHLTARNQVAFSLHNSDIRGGAITDAELEELGAEGLPFTPEDVENLIVINEYFSPLDLADGDVLNSSAILSNWGLVLGRNETQIGFRRIGGAYQSLGNSFLTPDQQELRLSDRFRMLGNQVYVDLGGALTSDNLDGQYDGSVGTTSRQSLTLGLGWYPRGRDIQARLGLEHQTESNESLDNYDPAEFTADFRPQAERDAETQQIDGGLLQIRTSFSGGLNLWQRRHLWNVNIVRQDYTDEVGRIHSVPVPQPFGGLDSTVARNDRSFQSLQLGVGWKTSLAAKTGLDVGLSFYDSDYDEEVLTDYQYVSLRFAVDRSWYEGRLKATLRSQFQQIGTEQTDETGSKNSGDYLRTDLGFRVGWKILPNLDLSSRLEWQGYSGDRDDSYLRVVCRLSQSF